MRRKYTLRSNNHKNRFTKMKWTLCSATNEINKVKPKGRKIRPWANLLVRHRCLIWLDETIFSRVRKSFRFPDWLIFMAKRVFHTSKSIWKTQYLYNKSNYSLWCHQNDNQHQRKRVTNRRLSRYNKKILSLYYFNQDLIVVVLSYFYFRFHFFLEYLLLRFLFLSLSSHFFAFFLFFYC